MRTKKLMFLLFLALVPGMLFAQDNFKKVSVFHMSFFPPLSTHGKYAKEYTNYVSVNLLAGISKNEKVLTFGGLANIIENDASGVQFAGLYNRIGNDASGVQFAGLYNHVVNEGEGVQFGGLLNIAGESYSGLQFAGVTNVSKHFTGFQFAGLGNVADDITGFQFGGVFNVARNVHGVQFGTLLNIAENSDYPIGLVNIIKNGEMGIGVTYNNTGSIVASFRSGGRVLYGIVGVGYNYDTEDVVFEAGFGAHIPVVSRFRINTELKAASLESFSDDYFLHSSFSILPAFRLLPNLEIFAGPSLNHLVTDKMSNKKVFRSHDLWNKYTAKRLQQLYIGFEVGTQFVF